MNKPSRGNATGIARLPNSMLRIQLENHKSSGSVVINVAIANATTAANMNLRNHI